MLKSKNDIINMAFQVLQRRIHFKVKDGHQKYMSQLNECYEPKQATNTTFEGKQCEGKFLPDLGRKMTTSGYFQGFPSVLEI